MRPLFSVLFISMLFLFACKKDKQTNADPQPQIQTSVMTDPRDGQQYKIVKIGEQWWMAENLNYNTPSGSWYYNNDSVQYEKPYGRLYLYYTAMNNDPNNMQGIAPPGWHIPSDGEWTELEDYLKKFQLGADALKESDSTHWSGVNTGTNRCKFNGVAAGVGHHNGTAFASMYEYTIFLSSSMHAPTGTFKGRCIVSDKDLFYPTYTETFEGCSIRCVKDE